MLRSKIGLWARVGVQQYAYHNNLHQNLTKIPIITAINYSSRIYDDDDDTPSIPIHKQSRRLNLIRKFEDTTKNHRLKTSFNGYSTRNTQSNFMGQKNHNRYGDRDSNDVNGASFFGQFSIPKWNESDLPKIEKNFYQPDSSTLSRSIEEIANYCKIHEIRAPLGAPKPILGYDELKSLPGNVLDEMRKRNFESLTPIQAQGWPIALSGNNMVGIAQTGSGKTLGFILPAIVHILNQPPQNIRNGPIALVMAPTRELAQQIQVVVNEFGLSSGVRNACLFGGASKNMQANQLRNAHLVIGTPGRLIDMIGSGYLNLQNCSFLVLDEADRMLDMGFEPQIRKIIGQIRPDRQTLMFSATWPLEVRSLAQDYLKEYIQVNIGTTELRANPNIKQIINICTPLNKDQKFLDIVKSITEVSSENQNKILVFTQTKRMADRVAHKLHSLGLNCTSIHSDKSQYQRENILKDFRDNNLEILVATEVAARGLDVHDINYVINYDFPNTVTEYIHRIGRTGRQNKTGTAYTLVTEENVSLITDLIAVLKQANQAIDPELYEMAQTRGKTSNATHHKRFRRY